VAGDPDQARSTLTNLRRRLDGCETGGAADTNDWILDCASQDTIRALIDALIAAI
jgi:hypothetical protein